MFFQSGKWILVNPHPFDPLMDFINLHLHSIR